MFRFPGVGEVLWSMSRPTRCLAASTRVYNAMLFFTSQPVSGRFDITHVGGGQKTQNLRGPFGRLQFLANEVNRQTEWFSE